MIKSENGKVVIAGELENVLVDLAIITEALMHGEVSERLIRTAALSGIEHYKENHPDEYKGNKFPEITFVNALKKAMELEHEE